MDPAFVKFYEGQWAYMIDHVIVPGVTGPLSWDRRAAYLLWCMSKGIKPRFTVTTHHKGYPYKFDITGMGFV